MSAYYSKTLVQQDGTITLTKLPFHAGETVEIIIVPIAQAMGSATGNYSLRGKPVQYVDPTEPVAQDDWEILK